MRHLKMSLIWGLLICAAASAQVTLNVTANPAIVRPGQSTTISLTLATNVPVAGVQWTLGLPTGWSTVQTITPAAAAPPKQLSCGSSTCFVWGLNVLPVPAGPIVTAPITVPLNTAPGPQTIALTGLVASTPSGVATTITGLNATVTVLSNFDINGDGQVTTSDVNAVVAQVASGTCANDVVGNGQCNLLQVIAEVIAWSNAGSKP